MSEEWKDRIFLGLAVLVLGNLGVLPTQQLKLTQQEARDVHEVSWIDVIERLDRIEEKLKED